MVLEKIGSNPRFDHQAKSMNYSAHSIYRDAENNRKHVYSHFPHFGPTSESAHDFRVSLDWSDVEAILRVFCEMKHPEAARLMQAKNLAAAVGDFAKDRK